MKCAIYTLAYNAQSFLHNAIDSIFAQNFEDWVYYIVDNGSTDSTWEVIQDYAERDSRIIPLRNYKTRVWEKGNSWHEIALSLPADDYFCFLDADDKYKPTFLKDTMDFAKTNSLEVAACGYDTITVRNGIITNEVYSFIPSKKVIIDHNDFILYSEYFPVYFSCMRSMWAKLYSVSLLQRFDWGRILLPPHIYGRDILMATEKFRSAKRIGVLPQSVYNYYCAPRTELYSFSLGHADSTKFQDQVTRELLLEKVGYITLDNEMMIQSLYMRQLNNLLSILFADKSVRNDDGIKHLHYVLTFPCTVNLFGSGYMKKDVLLKTFRDPIKNWISSFYDELKPESKNIIPEIQMIVERGAYRPS